jgi:molybdopterin molybdotransferase
LTAQVIEAEGELLVHGIAMKPGKPTILGVVDNKPVFGLPGHPVAAYLVTELFVRPLIAGLMGTKVKRQTTIARINEALSSNHGREEYIAVQLERASKNMIARPVRSKSGLISSLAGVDGYICVKRDSEGLAAGTEVEVVYF